MIDATGDIPLIGTLFGGAPYGIGIFTAGLILSIMILPFISAVTRDVFETVPAMLKEATYGLGCTTWEVMWRVVLPFARSGVVGGAMLALGRALGETMAVTFVIGNAHTIEPSLFAPGTTISATIANEFTEATSALYTSSLISLGLILFFITFIVLACAQLMLRALERQAGRNDRQPARFISAAASPMASSSSCPFAAAIFGLIWLALHSGRAVVARRRRDLADPVHRNRRRRRARRAGFSTPSWAA